MENERFKILIAGKGNEVTSYQKVIKELCEESPEFQKLYEEYVKEKGEGICMTPKEAWNSLLNDIKKLAILPYEKRQEILKKLDVLRPVILLHEETSFVNNEDADELIKRFGLIKHPRFIEIRSTHSEVITPKEALKSLKQKALTHDDEHSGSYVSYEELEKQTEEAYQSVLKDLTDYEQLRNGISNIVGTLKASLFHGTISKFQRYHLEEIIEKIMKVGVKID